MAEHDNATWLIHAASGRQHILCRSLGRWRDPDILCCEFQVESEFWDRCDAVPQAALVPDFGVALPQVLISMAMLRKLEAHLDDWMQSRTFFDCQICTEALGDQTLMVSVGTRAGVISSVEKPTLTLAFRCGHAMSAEWVFVVDQTCILAWRDSLQEFLQGVSEPAK